MVSQRKSPDGPADYFASRGPMGLPMRPQVPFLSKALDAAKAALAGGAGLAATGLAGAVAGAAGLPGIGVALGVTTGLSSGSDAGMALAMVTVPILTCAVGSFFPRFGLAEPIAMAVTGALTGLAGMISLARASLEGARNKREDLFLHELQSQVRQDVEKLGPAGLESYIRDKLGLQVSEQRSATEALSGPTISRYPVLEVAPNSLADLAGLKKGDEILFYENGPRQTSPTDQIVQDFLTDRHRPSVPYYRPEGLVARPHLARFPDLQPGVGA